MSLDLTVAPRRFAGGLANLNYLIWLDGAWAVLRRAPNGPLPRGANDMVREHRVLSSLWRAFPLAPRSIHLCADPSVAGTPFQILEYRDGAILRGAEVSPLPDTATTGARLSAMMIDTLAAVHAAPLASVGLNDLGRPTGFVRRTAEGWIARAFAVMGESPPTSARELIRWLTEAPLPEAQHPTLLHNDFKLDNIILDPKTADAVGIVDWDMATQGDPLLDLSTLLSYWAEPGDPDAMQDLAQMPTARPGFWTREAAAVAYARQTGRSLDAFRAHRVLAIFRLGVVFHQLHARYKSEGSSDPRHGTFARIADGIFDFGVDVAAGKRF
ncbi:MAG TPA: phosphotransferase family protein [Phenylobacterium sp.]|jgi:aminoglycoside phosphotransferase (APT) family kinase protein|nr:phosphotransferase family protein [Phenylobacterium sp.]